MTWLILYFKIVENEETLTKFANSANGKILKKDGEKGEDLLQALLTFSMKENTAEKRSRVQTTKLKESLEQEVTLSPKKRKLSATRKPEENKKRSNENKTEPEGSKEIIKPGKVRAEKKKKEEKTSLLISEEINDLCDLDSQFLEQPDKGNFCIY